VTKFEFNKKMPLLSAGSDNFFSSDLKEVLIETKTCQGRRELVSDRSEISVSIMGSLLYFPEIFLQRPSQLAKL